MQVKDATIGQRAYALLNLDGRTGFDAMGSRWATVEIVKRGVSTIQVGPVRTYGKATPTEYVDGLAEGTGRYFVVKLVPANKEAGEPSYFNVGPDSADRFYYVGPHQLTDIEGYLIKTAAKAEKQAEKDAERERQAAEAKRERIQRQLVMLDQLAESMNLTLSTREIMREMVRTEAIQINRTEW